METKAIAEDESKLKKKGITKQNLVLMSKVAIVA